MSVQTEEARRKHTLNAMMLRMADSFPEVGPILRNPRRRTEYMKLVSGLGALLQPPHTCPPPEIREVRVPVEVPIPNELTRPEMARLLRHHGWIVKAPRTQEEGGEQRKLSAGTHAHRMLRAFYDAGAEGATDEDARIAAGLSARSTFWKRSSELRENGYIAWAVDPESGEYETRVAPGSGVSVHVSVITEDGVDALRALEQAS